MTPPDHTHSDKDAMLAAYRAERLATLRRRRTREPNWMLWFHGLGIRAVAALRRAGFLSQQGLVQGLVQGFDGSVEVHDIATFQRWERERDEARSLLRALQEAVNGVYCDTSVELDNALHAVAQARKEQGW